MSEEDRKDYAVLLSALNIVNRRRQDAVERHSHMTSIRLYPCALMLLQLVREMEGR